MKLGGWARGLTTRREKTTCYEMLHRASELGGISWTR